LWLSDQNFVTWKDYMLMPLLLVATALVIKSRRDVKTVIIITAISLLLIDRSSILESMSRSFNHFDESKRSAGPLAFAGSNGLAAFLAQFTMFFWGLAQYVRIKKYRLICYGIVGVSLFATMYTFSRSSYIAIVAGATLLGIFKNRKLLIVIFVFLLTWQTVVPSAVTERVQMTQDSNGRLEASAEERVRLWEAARDSFISSPIFGTGYATFQFGNHVDGLRDTHNWYVKVLAETGLIGAAIAFLMLQQMLKLAYGLYKRGEGSLYQGLGFGLLLLCVSSFILNCFGDRWTYIEINGLLWVLVGAAICVTNMADSEAETNPASAPALASPNPYLLYR
jgi:O-antigen ligase